MARILAIDDSPSIRALVSTALGTDGHGVTAAVDGAEALTLVSSQAFDLVITDFNMPKLNGLEFIKRYREKNKFTPVLVLTTEVNPTLRQSTARTTLRRQLGATRTAGRLRRRGGWSTNP